MKRISYALGLILATTSWVQAEQIKVNVEMANPYLPALKKQTTYVKVGLTGFKYASKKDRPAVNLALVIDKSGSMSGEKIQRARDAAKQAVDRLSENDILSIVAYDDKITVLLPATRVSDKAQIKRKIDQLKPGGHTALFAGVNKGAKELRKFIDRKRVNRIILLSDGLANVGPSGATELGELGRQLGKERISVTTLGLGENYNEDLLSQLAMKSDGNHKFVQNPEELTKIFNYEFGDVLSVAAQEINVKIKCRDGIRPVRLLGRQGEIEGQNVHVYLNQLYSLQEKYVMLEVEVPSSESDTIRPVAEVGITYANMETQTTDALSSSVSVRFTASAEKVVDNLNKPVMIQCVSQIATLNTRVACELKDSGKVKEANEVLLANGDFIKYNNTILNSEKLDTIGLDNIGNIKLIQEDVSPAEWNKGRKQIIDEAFRIELQRGF